MSDLNFLEILKSIWSGLLLLSFFLAVFSFFWGFVDLIFLIRYEGKLKRGIKIWSKPLSDELRKYLSTLSQDVIETRKIWFSDRKVGFIRVENQEVLIHYRRPKWGTSWPYVGYVDLSEPESTLEFRSSLPMHLLLSPFILSGVGIPFVLLLMVFNYYMESTAIESFLRQKVEVGKQGSLLVSNIG